MEFGCGEQPNSISQLIPWPINQSIPFHPYCLFSIWRLTYQIPGPTWPLYIETKHTVVHQLMHGERQVNVRKPILSTQIDWRQIYVYQYASSYWIESWSLEPSSVLKLGFRSWQSFMGHLTTFCFFVWERLLVISLGYLAISSAYLSTCSHIISFDKHRCSLVFLLE